MVNPLSGIVQFRKLCGMLLCAWAPGTENQRSCQAGGTETFEGATAGRERTYQNCLEDAMVMARGSVWDFREGDIPRCQGVEVYSRPKVAGAVWWC